MQHFTTIQPASPAHMPLDIPTLSESLSAAGYDAHAIGKWYDDDTNIHVSFIHSFVQLF